jgi:hypothetical protein
MLCTNLLVGGGAAVNSKFNTPVSEQQSLSMFPVTWESIRSVSYPHTPIPSTKLEALGWGKAI